MTDFSKILNHPEKQVIITKLVSGETAKSVSNYLRNKYTKPDENHLRIPIKMMEEFVQLYGAKYGFIKQVIRDEEKDFNKEIAQSLLDNSEWRDRIEKVTDDEINLRLKLNQILKILEARAEQIFDKIQENPSSVKIEYQFDKIMNTLLMVIERIDKIQNDRPDMKIEHTYSIQMVEQHTVAFQEAIRKVLQRMSPEFTVLFMEYLGEELNSLKPGDIPNAPVIATNKDFDKHIKATDKLLETTHLIEADMEDDNDDKSE